MRDLSAHEKHETQKLQKDLEEKKNENTELRKASDKYQAKIAELENTIAELHEQVFYFIFKFVIHRFRVEFIPLLTLKLLNLFQG